MTVNGPSGMYKIKPFYATFKTIALPNCIYKMKNLHASHEMSAKKESNDPYQVLAQRQETIINRLEELKSQVVKIKKELGVESETKTIISESNINFQNTNKCLTDIVVNASPSNPPYSLWVFRNILRENNLKVSLSSHTHSSVVDVPENVKKLPFDLPDNRMENNVKFTLIWKNVGLDTELIVKPLLQNTIQGEANVIRYIARTLLPDLQGNTSPENATEIDCWLDKSYFSLLQGNNKERQSFLRQMNGHLGKAEYLGGNDFTIADIAVWSAIAQVQLEKSLPSNVGSWWKKLSTKTAFLNIF